MELLKNININKHTIKLVEDKQLPYGPIYNLRLMKLEILKTYIKINIKTGFIQLSKSSASTLILFNKKLDSSLYVYINYQKLNNLTIKNWYFLLLIGKFLDQLDWAKHFIQLDLTIVYYWIRIQKGDK